MRHTRPSPGATGFEAAKPLGPMSFWLSCWVDVFSELGAWTTGYCPAQFRFCFIEHAFSVDGDDDASARSGTNVLMRVVSMISSKSAVLPCGVA